jgi:hypothetical protein
MGLVEQRHLRHFQRELLQGRRRIRDRASKYRKFTHRHLRLWLIAAVTLGSQLLHQRLRLFEVARVEPLGKPPVNRSQQFARLAHLALVAPEAARLMEARSR